MALLASEIQALRTELGYNALSVGAEPYISYVAIFDNVVAAYLNAGATTTSTTAVTAATSATPVALTLASATGFAAFCRVVVDVDDRQEVATVQSVAGSTTISLLLSGAHSGTYPVSVEGGESLVRDVLRKIHDLTKPGGALTKAASSAGVAKVDEIEFFTPGAGTKSRIAELQSLRMYYRDELSAITGVPNLWRARSGRGSVELY